jgi:hypothetical protein
MKTSFEFNPDMQETVAKHFPDWQKRLNDAARNELIELLIASFEAEKSLKKEAKSSLWKKKV